MNRQTIALNREYTDYLPGKPALMLLNIDREDMPPDIKRKLKDIGGVWEMLVSLVPELATAAHVVHRRADACLYREDIGEDVAGADSLHIYVLVKDGGDIERFLRDLHARCRLQGFGWYAVGEVGQTIERSIVDVAAGAPTRLIRGDPEKCQPVVMEGLPLDTRAVFPPTIPNQTYKE